MTLLLLLTGYPSEVITPLAFSSAWKYYNNEDEDVILFMAAWLL
jgi:hypothetical protein